MPEQACAGAGRRAGRRRAWVAALALAAPPLLMAAFHRYEQAVVQRRTWVDLSRVEPQVPAVRMQLERQDAADRAIRHVSGWAVRTDGAPVWLQPSVLVVAPDGQATEFRANLRARTDLQAVPTTDKQRSMAGFDVRMQTRHFPPGQPLRIVVAITDQGRRIHLDTGADVDGLAP